MTDRARTNPLDDDLQTNLAAALAAGAALGDAKANPEPHGSAYVIVPEGFKVQYLDEEPRPLRKSGTVKAHDLDSFIAYVNRHAAGESVIYGSMDPARFVAVLNDHAPTRDASALSSDSSHVQDDLDGRFRDFRCDYPLVYSREWITWTSRDRKPFPGNKEFAEWLEDNLVDVVEPAQSDMMRMAVGFSVSAGASFSNPVDLDSGSTRLAYTLEAKQGAVEIPKLFKIGIPVFRGLEAKVYTLEARFRYKLREGGVDIRYELIRPHKVVEQAFKDELDLLREKTKCLVLFGEP